MSEAQKLLNDSSLLLKTGSGSLKLTPLFDVIQRSMEMVNKLCREFGLTPSARSRIRVPGKDVEADPLDDAIFGRGAELLVLPRSG
jgi:P27 family predicted phage terminase small subunit